MNIQTQKRIQDYPRFRECSIQTFNDQNKEEKSKSRILPMTDTYLEWCVKLQELMPYWILFSVNPMQEGKRNRDSVKAIQTWICDIDEGSKESQLELIKKAPLPPSLVVESNHGFHIYYLANRDLTETEFEDGNWWLKNYYNGDPKVCKDTARVLRIPWYYHMKGEKYMVNYREDLSSKGKYSVAQMLEAFPDQVQTTPWREKARDEYNKRWDKKDWFRTRAKEDLNTRKMLEELSWTSRVAGETFDFKPNSNWTYQIYCNGKSTSCWIDDKDKIGSRDKWWPRRTDRLERYWVVDRSALAKYLKEKHPEIVDKTEAKQNDKPKLRTTLPRAKNEYKWIVKADYTRWDKELDRHMGMMRKGQLIVLVWETGAGKSTFATFIARKNKSSYFVLENTANEVADTYANRVAGIEPEQADTWLVTDEQMKRYETAYNQFFNSWVEYIDCWPAHIDEITSTMLELKEEGYGLFILDNLGKISCWIASEMERTERISNILLDFCIREHVCIILLHHFKKKQNPFMDRDIGQMRWSWKVWDDAFTVIYYSVDKLTGDTKLEVWKDRKWNRTKMYQLWFDCWDFRFVSELWRATI